MSTSSSSSGIKKTCSGQQQQQQGSQASSSDGQQSPADDGPSKIRVEFAVNINNQDDLNRIEGALKLRGVNLVSSDLDGKLIQFDLQVDRETNVSNISGGELKNSAHSLQKFIEEQTGLLTVVKGLGELNSAVAELRPPPPATGAKIEGGNHACQVMGVVRLSQLEDSKCYADASLDGLMMSAEGRRYRLAIHEFGDLAGDGYENIGNPLIPIQEATQLDGDGKSPGCGKFVVNHRLLQNCDVASMIGRSIAFSELIESNQQPDGAGTTDNKKQRVLSAGVVARASTIGLNKKKICSCSGKTLWEERMGQRRPKSGGIN